MSIKRIRMLFILLISAAFIAVSVLPFALTSAKEAAKAPALNNGLARTPPMGWNSWNRFGCNITDAQVRQMADAMVSSGMAAAGYQYIVIDDCWQGSGRTNGHVQLDPDFPNMKALADYVHSKGLKFGLYSDRGTNTCAGRVGSYGNETTDANDYASWGVDYLKYDNCNPASGSNQQADYTRMRDALASSGRPIVFSICAWDYASWMPSVGNLWRTTGDISNSWTGMIWIPDINNQTASSAGPGAWNDPDMLEVGNGGMTDTENQSHMSLWVIMAAPLISGNDLRSMTQATKDILTNPEVVAVDQDPLGVQGTRVWVGGSGNWLNIWSKQLSGSNARAVALFNGTTATASITVSWSQIGLPSGSATVRDLWARADRGTFNNSYTASVPAHGTVLVKIVSGGITPTTVPPTSVPPTNVPPTSVPNGTVSINVGGSATGSFVADQYFSGGSTYTNTATIDMSQITTNPPPAAVFSTERYGAMTYTIPNRSGAQTVTLYFAETYVTAAGQRLFNVSINGAAALSNFDIYASAGGANRAIARTFSTTANSSGQVVIQFTAITQNPKINGITVTAGGPLPTTVPPTGVPPTGVPPTGVPPTGVPPTGVPPTGVPPTSVPPTSVPPTSGPGACSPVTSVISAPFTFDGAGTFCWQTNNLGSYINSWNLDSLVINGVDFTNRWVGSGSYPPAINGSWYISYRGSFAWSHFEAR